MTQAPLPSSKLLTEIPQLAPGRAARGGGEVVELEHGITVYPARGEH